MINMYGVEGLSFQNNTASLNKDTLIAEETKMSETHLKYSGKKEQISAPSNDIEDIINDPTINNLTLSQIQEEINKIENEMQKEIEHIKEKYNQKIQKYNKSLTFLKDNQFLKNINEYKVYKQFANKIKQQINFGGSTEKKENPASSFI